MNLTPLSELKFLPGFKESFCALLENFFVGDTEQPYETLKVGIFDLYLYIFEYNSALMKSIISQDVPTHPFLLESHGFQRSWASAHA